MMTSKHATERAVWLVDPESGNVERRQPYAKRSHPYAKRSRCYADRSHLFWDRVSS